MKRVASVLFVVGCFLSAPPKASCGDPAVVEASAPRTTTFNSSPADDGRCTCVISAQRVRITCPVDGLSVPWLTCLGPPPKIRIRSENVEFVQTQDHEGVGIECTGEVQCRTDTTDLRADRLVVKDKTVLLEGDPAAVNSAAVGGRDKPSLRVSGKRIALEFGEQGIRCMVEGGGMVDSGAPVAEKPASADNSR